LTNASRAVLDARLGVLQIELAEIEAELAAEGGEEPADQEAQFMREARRELAELIRAVDEPKPA
jgi:hypothetical protein